MSSDALAFLGDDKTEFMKSSLAVYTDIDASGVLKYVGKTNPEKQITPGFAVAEWWDNTSGTQTLFVIDPDKVDFKVAFSFAQVIDESALTIAMHGQLDRNADPNFNQVFMGSNPGAFREGKWQFVGRGRTGRIIRLNIRRGIVVPTGTFSPGTPGQYASLGVEIRALQDTNVADSTRDLVYWEIQKTGS